MEPSLASPKMTDQELFDSDLYVYLIQVVIWHALFTPRIPPATSKALCTTSSSSAATAGKGKDAATHRHRGVSAITDMFGPKGTKSKESKFPEKLVKRVGERTSIIAKGQDPTYRGPGFCATMAKLNTKFEDKEFRHSLKESRRIEDLIMHFATLSQAAFGSTIQESEGKELSNSQVAQFVHVVRDTLAGGRMGKRELLHSSKESKELLARLDSYIIELENPPQLRGHASNISIGDTPISSSPRSQATPSVASPIPTSALTMSASQLVSEQPVLRAIAKLMGVEHGQLLQDIGAIRFTSTDKAALADLRHTFANVNRGDAWPGRQDDFGHEKAWEAWKTKELDSLSKRIATLSASKQTDTHHGTNDSADWLGTEFVFIPDHPARLYQHLSRTCFDHDLNMIATSEDDAGVEMTILSAAHLDLLEKTAEVWRIRGPFTRLTHLQLVLDQLERQDGPIAIPLDCVDEVVQRLEQVIVEQPPNGWMIREQGMLHDACLRALECALVAITDQLQDLQHIDVEELYRWSDLVERIGKNLMGGSLKVHQKLESRLEGLKDSIRVQAVQEYKVQASEIWAQHEDEKLAIGLHQLYVWLSKRTRKLVKQFAQPLLENNLDVVSLVLDKQMHLFWDDMVRLKPQVEDMSFRDQDGIPGDDLFVVYNDMLELQRLFQHVCPELTWSFDFTTWFQPHVDHWLERTSNKTSDWVDTAVRIDSFEPIESVGAFHSSSIDDLFSALQQPSDFLDSLDWPDPIGLAQFKTSLAKTFSLAIEKYCARIEGMFMTEINMRPLTTVEPAHAHRHHAWMERAKQTLRDEEKVEPFQLHPATCIKLNNIEKARQLLDTLYSKMDAEAQSKVLAQAPHLTQQEGIILHLDRTFCSLKRCENEMVQTIVDKISVFIRHSLSRKTVKSLVKSDHTIAMGNGAMGKRLGRVKNFASSAWAASKTNGHGDSTASTRSADTVPSHLQPMESRDLTDVEIENAIVQLLDYLDDVLATINANLSPEERLTVLGKVWEQVLVTLQGIMMPSLSNPSDVHRPFSDQQIDVVMKWRSFLFNYFMARDEETNEVHGLPADVLLTAQYRELDEFVVLKDLSTDQLMHEYSNAAQALQRKPAEHPAAPSKDQEGFTNKGVILRILCMRPGAQGFVAQQLKANGATAALPNRSSWLGIGHGHRIAASLSHISSSPSSNPYTDNTTSRSPVPPAIPMKDRPVPATTSHSPTHAGRAPVPSSSTSTTPAPVPPKLPARPQANLPESSVTPPLPPR